MVPQRFDQNLKRFLQLFVPSQVAGSPWCHSLHRCGRACGPGWAADLPAESAVPAADRSQMPSYFECLLALNSTFSGEDEINKSSFCSQTLSIRFCQSSGLFVQSGPTQKDASGRHRRQSLGRTPPAAPAAPETKGRLERTLLSIRPQTRHPSASGAPEEPVPRRRGRSFTT